MTIENIGVLVVDDHPAVRAGLRALIDAEHDMNAVGEASDSFGVEPAIHTSAPDVVLLDYQLPETNGIKLCKQIKSGRTPPKVIIYTSFLAPLLSVPARIAGADALVDKGAPPLDLAATIRRVASSESTPLEVPAAAMALATDLIGPDDLPILKLLVEQASPREVADSLNMDDEEVDRRTQHLLEVLT